MRDRKICSTSLVSCVCCYFDGLSVSRFRGTIWFHVMACFLHVSRQFPSVNDYINVCMTWTNVTRIRFKSQVATSQHLYDLWWAFCNVKRIWRIKPRKLSWTTHLNIWTKNRRKEREGKKISSSEIEMEINMCSLHRLHISHYSASETYLQVLKILTITQEIYKQRIFFPLHFANEKPVTTHSNHRQYQQK